MLKLQSKGGKFDIVLSDASLKDVGSIKKNNVRSLSSAGRRKSKEVKGHRILPNTKDESPRVAKGRESRLITNAKPKEEKAEKRTASKTSDKPNKNSEQQPLARTSRGSNLAGSKKNPNATTKKGTAGFLKDDQKKTGINAEAGVVTQSDLMTLIESLRGGDALSLKEISGNKSGADTMSPAKNNENFGHPLATYSDLDLNHKISAALTESKPDSVLYQKKEAPTTSANSGHSKSKDSVSTISLGESQTVAYGTPVQDTSGSYASAPGKAERIAMRSSFAVGAPGQVAYDYNQVNREKNKQWLADLEKQIQAKKQMPMSDKERLARAMEDPASVPSKPIPANQPVEPLPAETNVIHTHSEGPYLTKVNIIEADLAYQSERDESFANQKSFARGQHSTKDQFEVDEMERQKKKILEHQRAVEQQVEEKRRLKMIEREKRIQDELKEEEKFAKEREQMAWQYEQENRKQMEREEAERQRHEALQKSVLEAYDAAKREKLNARLQKLKARGHDVSKLEQNLLTDTSNVNEGEISDIEKELSRLTIPSVSVESNHMISSRSDKEFRPILNLTDDTYEEKGKERKKSKENMNKENKKTKTSKSDKANLKKSQDALIEESEEKVTINETKKMNPKRSYLDLKKRKDKDVNQNLNVNKGSQKSSKKSVEGRSNVAKDSPRVGNLNKKTKPTKTKSERLLIEHEDIHGTDLSQMTSVYDDDDDDDHYGGITPSVTTLHVDDFGNDDEFSYNRSSTVNLEEELSLQRGFIANQSRTSYNRSKEETSSWETRTFPTERQQQILDQLQELRKGLLNKQREYERGTTPSAEEFVNIY